MTIIPVPDNPAHVDNLASVELLETQGFCGPDVSIKESLFSYEMVWRQLENGEWLFIYRNPHRPGRWDRSSIAECDPTKEWDWAFKDSHFYSYLGLTPEEWSQIPFPLRVWDLNMYWGSMEIFGDSYWEGFEISGVE